MTELLLYSIPIEVLILSKYRSLIKSFKYKLFRRYHALCIITHYYASHGYLTYYAFLPTNFIRMHLLEVIIERLEITNRQIHSYGF